MSVLEQDKFRLKVEWQSLKLEIDECNEIRHYKVGEPMRVFKIRQGDTAPTLRATLFDEFNKRLMLTANNEIKFVLKEQFYYEQASESIIIQSTDNVILSPQDDECSKGQLQYVWQDGDTDECGSYLGLFQITLNGLESQYAGPFALADGQTLEVSVDGGATQTVTFNTADFVDITEATTTEVVAVLNTQLTGAQAFESVSDQAILLQTTDPNLTGSIQVQGGTANLELGFDNALSQNRRVSLPQDGVCINIVESFEDN